MAKQAMASTHVRIVPVYARRPKMASPGQDQVLMKINYSLFQAAAVADKYGCPTLAGVPLATRLAGLTSDARCAWFRITANGDTPSDHELVVSVTAPGTTRVDHPGIEGPIPEDEMAEHICASACAWSWQDATEIMRVVRRVGMGHGGFFRSGYQPFFAILPGAGTELRTLDSEPEWSFVEARSWE